MDADQATEFTSLYSRNERQLFRFIASLLPSTADAEDLLQETAKKIWQQFEQYQTDKPFLPWACTIARYELLSHLKRQQVRRKYFSNEVVELLADDWSRRDEAREGQSRALEQCVKKLPDDDRRLLHLRYEGEESIQELPNKQTARRIPSTSRCSEFATYCSTAGKNESP
ncbi:MAG: hypothetical protein CMJ78_21235 [Planctomycetaceae bacterium]|nr:hypothetical protein [Planctomycetaceae bacterium]